MIEKDVLISLYKKFRACAPLFIALGDESRQKLILDIADAGKEGINVTNLSAKSHLSRPAISHHLKVLKDANLIRPLKIGTQIFYQLTLGKNLETMKELINSVQPVVAKITEEYEKNIQPSIGEITE